MACQGMSRSDLSHPLSRPSTRLSADAPRSSAGGEGAPEPAGFIGPAAPERPAADDAPAFCKGDRCLPRRPRTAGALSGHAPCLCCRERAVVAWTMHSLEHTRPIRAVHGWCAPCTAGARPAATPACSRMAVSPCVHRWQGVVPRARRRGGARDRGGRGRHAPAALVLRAPGRRGRAARDRGAPPARHGGRRGPARRRRSRWAAAGCCAWRRGTALAAVRGLTGSRPMCGRMRTCRLPLGCWGCRC